VSDTNVIRKSQPCQFVLR